MCYLDVAADAEGLPLGGEEGVRHLLRGGLDGLLDLLLGDTLHTGRENTRHGEMGREDGSDLARGGRVRQFAQ